MWSGPTRLVAGSSACQAWSKTVSAVILAARALLPLVRSDVWRYAITMVVRSLPCFDHWFDSYFGISGGVVQHDVDYPTATLSRAGGLSGGQLVYLLKHPQMPPVPTQPERTPCTKILISPATTAGPRPARLPHPHHRCVGLLGWVPWAQGTYAVLQRNAALIAARRAAHRGAQVAVRNLSAPAVPGWARGGRSVTLCNDAWAGTGPGYRRGGGNRWQLRKHANWGCGHRPRQGTGHCQQGAAG